LTPEQRLDAILWDEKLTGSPPYGTSWPTVCFTESRPDGLAFLFREKGWSPWGIVLNRDWIASAGGCPAWHVPERELVEVRQLLPDRIAARTVRLDPGKSDWLHEHEWRLPLAPGDTALKLETEALQAVIVGDPFWTPLRSDGGPNPYTGDIGDRAVVPPLVDGRVERWCWDHASNVFTVLPAWVSEDWSPV
jgi:hypothetical protein